MYKYFLILAPKAETNRGNEILSRITCLQRNASSQLTRHSEYWNIPRFRTNYGLQILKFTLPHTRNEFKVTSERLRLLSQNDVLNLSF